MPCQKFIAHSIMRVVLQMTSTAIPIDVWLREEKLNVTAVVSNGEMYR